MHTCVHENCTRRTKSFQCYEHRSSLRELKYENRFAENKLRILEDELELLREENLELLREENRTIPYREFSMLQPIDVSGWEEQGEFPDDYNFDEYLAAALSDDPNDLIRLLEAKPLPW